MQEVTGSSPVSPTTNPAEHELTAIAAVDDAAGAPLAASRGYGCRSTLRSVVQFSTSNARDAEEIQLFANLH